MSGARCDEEEGQQELLQKALPPCPHLQPDSITSLQWRPGGQQRAPAERACQKNGGALTPGREVREHRIPLPATELGDTALVTTKTVKEGE